MKKNLAKGILYGLGAVMLGYIVVSSDWTEIVSHLKATPLKAIMLLLIFQCITMLLINIQWKSLASKVSDHISFLDIVLMNAQGSILDSLTPGVKMGGELGRILALKSKVGAADAAIVVGLQKTFSLLSFLLLTLGSLIWFSLNLGRDHRYYLYLFTAAITALTVILAALILFSIKPDKISGLLGKIFRGSKIKTKIDEALRKYSDSLTGLFTDKRLFISQMLLGTFIWSFYVFKLLVLVKSYNIEIDYISAAAITFLSYVMGMIPLLPGGIGSFESCMILLMKIYGLPMEVGATIAIVFRFATFWFEFILSGLILIAANIPIIGKGDKDAKVQAKKTSKVSA